MAAATSPLFYANPKQTMPLPCHGVAVKPNNKIGIR